MNAPLRTIVLFLPFSQDILILIARVEGEQNQEGRSLTFPVDFGCTYQLVIADFLFKMVFLTMIFRRGKGGQSNQKNKILDFERSKFRVCLFVSR